jgi:hypothetical protein
MEKRNMTTGITDLGQLERNAFSRFYDDGLVDVYVGVMLVITGAANVVADGTEVPGQTLIWMMVLAFGVTVPLLMLRRHLLRTRLGSFQPGPQRRKRIKGTWLALLASTVLGVVMFGIVMLLGGDFDGDTVGVVLPIVWFVNGVVVFGAGAYFLDVPRFYFHGVMWGLAMPLLIWPDLLWDYRLAPWLALGIPGGVIAAVGIDKLFTFLRRYPAVPMVGDIDA